MSHQPIIVSDLAFSLPHKLCFQGFSTTITKGQRIAIIGPNGAGKTSLLKILMGLAQSSAGEIKLPRDVVFAYVPQITEKNQLSGSQSLQKALSAALTKEPNVLCLDEPSNHLDQRNRAKLISMLQRFLGTLIIVSHDTELLKTGVIDVLWHLSDGRVHIFKGSYDNYIEAMAVKREGLEARLKDLSKQKKAAHKALMREQERAKKRKLYGEKKYGTDIRALRAAQGKGERTTNKNKKNIAQEKREVIDKLADISVEEIIKPRFYLESSLMNSKKPVLSIIDGACGYKNKTIVSKINLQLAATERLAIKGDNASGKTTLLKAVLATKEIFCTGTWLSPKKEEIGYLDQHYATLTEDLCALDIIWNAQPTWSLVQVRSHLNDFLFRCNEEVNTKVKFLSGGEKARLSLAHIAANPPRLLILDEITNNLDLVTKQHVIEVLRDYPSALLLVSHDEDFLAQIGVTSFYELGLIK